MSSGTAMICSMKDSSSSTVDTLIWLHTTLHTQQISLTRTPLRHSPDFLYTKRFYYGRLHALASETSPHAGSYV